MSLTATAAESVVAAGTYAAHEVNVDNFTRAETDTYFSGFVKEGAFGRLNHHRELADIDHQTVVRMNRDTLYSSGVFDLDAGPVTIILPDGHRRFISLQLVDQDHYNPAVAYEAGPHTYTRHQIGTRYLFLLVRLFVDPGDPADLDKVHALQDAIVINQPGGPGKFEIPRWDGHSLSHVREALKALGGFTTTSMFGTRETVNPVHHLIGTATGWAGNPVSDAKYISVKPHRNDGATVHRLTVKDVPVDAFWSLSVYNEEGFFEPNPQGAYSLNNVTAAPDPDGSYTIQFGGCGPDVSNCLPITAGWNYTVRMYRPRREVIEGDWTFPEAQPVD